MVELYKVEIIREIIYESLVCQIIICVFKKEKKYCICLCTLPFKKKENKLKQIERN